MTLGGVRFVLNLSPAAPAREMMTSRVLNRYRMAHGKHANMQDTLGHKRD